MQWRTAALLVLAVPLCVARAQTQHQVDITGDWDGTLSITGVHFPTETPIALHIQKTHVGDLTGTASFPNTGGAVVAITAIAFDGAEVTFRADAAQATFHGRLDQDDTVIKGIWTDAAQSSVEFHRATIANDEAMRVRRSDLQGYWTGTVTLNFVGCDESPSLIGIRYIFYIKNTPRGLAVSWDEFDGSEKGWIATSVARDHDSVAVGMKQIGAEFNGKINHAKTAIDGTWTWHLPSGHIETHPLVLIHSKHPPKLKERSGPLLYVCNGDDCCNQTHGKINE